MTTAIFGGSFNPPHLGHRSVVDTVLRELSPDRMLIIPDYAAPHKEMADVTPDPEDRLALCRLAFGDAEGAEVSDMEILRGGRSYTVGTLTELKEIYPDDRFILVIGSDMLLTFETVWYRFDDILKMCALAVVSREENDIDALQEHADWLMDNYVADIQILLNHEPVVESSTDVREELAVGHRPAGLSDAVWNYIQLHGLYLSQRESSVSIDKQETIR